MKLILLNGLALALIMHIGKASPMLIYGVVSVYTALQVIIYICMGFRGVSRLLRHVDLYDDGDIQTRCEEAYRAVIAEAEAKKDWVTAANAVRGLYLLQHKD